MKLDIPAAPPRHTRSIEIVCHRGANEYAPENTYAAAQICVDWSMDYVEIDVNTSKDGVLFLMHGPDVDRTTSGRGSFAGLTAAEIERLDAGSWFHPQYANERVPRLDQFLRWIKGKARLFIDVKAADQRPLIDLIHATGFENDCFFWSGSDQWMLQLRRLAPHLPLKVNVRTSMDVIAAHKQYRADIVEVDLPHMSQALVDVCRRYQIKSMVYVRENDPAAFRAVLEWGVDMINVNHGNRFAEIAAAWAGDASDPLFCRE